MLKNSKHVKLLSAFGSLLLLALVVICGLQVSKLSTKYSIREFYPKNHPILKLNTEVENRFQLHSTPTFLAVLSLNPNASSKAPGSDWLSEKNFAELKSITSQLEALPNVKSVTSLANVDIALNDQQALRVGTLSESVSPKDWKKTIDGLPLLKPQLISPDSKSVIVAVEPQSVETHDLQSLRDHLEAKLHERDLAHTSDTMTATVSGLPAIQIRLAERLQSEVGEFFALSLVIFVFMFFAFYRGLTPVVFATAGLVASNVVVIGVLAKVGVPFTVLLSTLPVIVSIAFVSLAVHTLYLWADRLEEAGSKAETLAGRFKLSLSTIREIFLANLLGSATTAIGFAMLATTQIPAIQTFALTVGASVLMTFLVSQGLLLVGLVWVRPVQRSWMKSRAWWTVTVTRFAIPILVGVLGLSLFATAAATKLNFSARLFDDLPNGDDVRRAMTQIDRDFGGTVSLDIELDGGKDGFWNEPKNLAALQNAIAKTRQQEGVGAALGVTDFFNDKIPESTQGVGETYFLYSMSTANPLRSYVDNEHRRVRVAIRLKDMSSDAVDLLRERIRGVYREVVPNTVLSETGLAVTGHTVNREVARGLVFGFWESLVVIGLLLMIVFRSFRWALVACVPNLIPPAILAGALAIAQTPVKPAVALIFSIALGLAFNNTVYLLTRLKRMQSEKKLDFLPLRRTLLEEGNPCLSESMLMFAGFLIFLLSDFQLNQTLGAYMVLSIGAGALADLVFLPALLKVFPRFVVPNRSNRFVAVRPWSEKNAIAASLIACLMVTFISANAHADEAADLLKSVQTNVESKTDEAKVTLVTTESNGDKQTRDLRLRSLRDQDGYKALVRIEAPADIKGTALLAEVKGGNQDQWLYLPSNKQVRRIVSGKKSAGVLGSELSPEDLNADALRGATAKLVKKDATSGLIEVTPTAGVSEYSKVLLTLDITQKIPTRMEYFVGDKVKKVVTFSDYQKISGVQRAQKIKVENLETKRATEVTLSDVKVNQALKANDFTVGALKSGK